MLRMNNITRDGHVDTTDLKWVELSKQESERLALRHGDLLFNRTNSPELVGKTAVWSGPPGFTFAGYLIRVRLRQDRVLPGWVARFMNSPEGKATLFNMAKPSINMSNISASDLLRLEVPVAPLVHQLHVLALLDKADAIRRKRKEAIALTDELLRSAFLEMFGDPVSNPKGWPLCTIGELCALGGSLVDGPFGSSLKPEHYTPSGVRVVRNWNIRDDYFDPAEFKFVTAMKFEEIRRSEVEPGDVLITTKGTVGDVCLMPDLGGRSVLSASGTVRLRLPTRGPVLAPFVVRQMILPGYQQYLHSLEAGSAQQYLNLSGIRKMRLIAPPLSHQKAFMDLRAGALALADRFSTGLDGSESLMKSIVQRAFRGTLGSAGAPSAGSLMQNGGARA